MRRVSKGSKGSTSAFLDPLIQTAQAGDQAGDQAGFDLAYRVIVQGCNDCHAAQTYGQIGRPFSFIKIQVPKNSPEDMYAYTP